ncbi:MAG: tRNA (N6-threonylcarbamoyladenosine(37)-N6)-methyltransferase TrmO, partial [Chloroflexota bacterium]|nr:tRNA (N6-threonylcarbamoyladenosine(37)-N6)-methyltransferase TrmO [Chloroflexota bacterium]
PHLTASDARAYLEDAIREEHLSGPYAAFPRRALEILIAAEREAHSSGQLDVGELPLTAIGLAHTPYSHEAPRQPQKAAKGEFYVELFTEFAAGLAGTQAFSHIYIISYLHRSSGYSLTVRPPWQEGEEPRTVGLFASRSPNRPSPLGLTRAKVRRIEGNRIYTDPLDLFDGTPVVDIKPHLRSVDEAVVGNDGWLADSDHLRLHKEGIPHQHAGEEAVLHEAQDILLDVMGAAKGLEFLGASVEDVICLTPVSVGGGEVRFSHGTLPVPAPAVTAILKGHRIPHVAGPVDAELLTPTGAALLAALQPRWRPREMGAPGEVVWQGLGLGTKELEPINGLRLALGKRANHRARVKINPFDRL